MKFEYAAPVPGAPDAVPLCVDVDDTLIRRSLTAVSIELWLKKNPLNVFVLPFFLFLGRAGFKRALASRVTLTPADVRLNAAIVEHVKREKAHGRAVWMVTGSDAALAASVAAFTPYFDGVIASDGRRNLIGAAKADELVRRFGARGFDYIANDHVDLPVWRQARRAFVYSADESLLKRVDAADCEWCHIPVPPERP